MSRRCLWVLLALLVICLACGRRQEKSADEVKVQTKDYSAKNDSMIYGLACPGCNDSVLVLLPDSGGDPIVYNILNARRNHKIFGRPAIGDKIAVLVDPEHPDELLTAVNLEQLMGTWVYMQMPQMRHVTDSARRDSILRTLTDEERERLDSIMRSYRVPVEYGYTLKRDFTVSVVGGPPRRTSLDAQTPMEYPPIMRYKEWHVYNGRLVFSYGGMKISNMEGANTELSHDTATLLILRRDTLALQFADKVQGFRLKPDSLQEE